MNARNLLVAATASLALLTACGGGGGSNSIPGTQPTPTPTPVVSPTISPTMTPTPGLTPTPAPTASPTTAAAPGAPAQPQSPPPFATATPAAQSASAASQRVEAQGGLSILGGLALMGSGGIQALVPSVPAIASGGSSGQPQSTCINGRQLTVQAGSKGVTTYVLKGYYDAGCSKPEYELDASITGYVNAQHAQTLSGTGIQTYYDGSGNPAGHINLTNIYVSGLNTSNVTEIFRGTGLIGGGVTTTAIGTECVVTGTSATCGDGLAVNAGALGSSFGTIASASIPSIGSLNGAAVAATNFAGSLYALGLSANVTTQPYFAITGSSQQDVLGATASASQLVLTDAANSVTLTITSGSNGSISGAITPANSNTPVATFTADRYGVGTISYSDGTTGQIFGYVVM